MRTLAGLLVLLFIGGCIPIPPGHPGVSRGNLPEGLPDWLEPGHTTMADVLFRLGEPDQEFDARTLGWVNIDRLGGGLLFVAFGPGAAAGGAASWERYSRLLIRFANDGTVTDRSIQSAVCTSGTWGIGNKSWDFGPDTNPAAGGCLPVPE